MRNNGITVTNDTVKKAATEDAADGPKHGLIGSVRRNKLPSTNS